MSSKVPHIKREVFASKTRARRWFTEFCCLLLALTPLVSSPLFCQNLMGREVSDQGRYVMWQNQFSWMDPSTVHACL